MDASHTLLEAQSSQKRGLQKCICLKLQNSKSELENSKKQNFMKYETMLLLTKQPVPLVAFKRHQKNSLKHYVQIIWAKAVLLNIECILNRH